MVLILAPTGAQGDGILDLCLSVCPCTLLNTALKKLSNSAIELGKVWEGCGKRELKKGIKRGLKKGIKRGLKRELTERAHRESSQREHTERAQREHLGEQAKKQASRQELEVHSVGAMPWRGLLIALKSLEVEVSGNPLTWRRYTLTERKFKLSTVNLIHSNLLINK